LPAGSLVAGNLPYQVATRIVQDLVRSPAAWECAAFLVQLEVAERLVAAPRQRAYGSLSVLVQARARVRLLGTVKPGAFRPPPAVDSAFVGLQPRSPSEEGGVAPDFDRFVRAGFARRRKTLRNNLLALGNADGVAAALAAAGVGPRMRPEELAVEAWQRLWAAAGAAGLQW